MESTYVPFDDIFINRLRRTNPFDMPVLHYHDGYEIFYLIEGERDFFIGDSEYKLKKGEFLLIKPFEMHFSFSTDNPLHDRYVLNFKIKELTDFLNDDDIQIIKDVFEKRIVVPDEHQQFFLMMLFANIKNALDKNDTFSHKSAVAGIIQMIAILKNSSIKENKEWDTNIILNAIKYINENYYNEISLEEIADYCGFVSSYFCRAFKKVTGTTFLQYLSTIRGEYEIKSVNLDLL